MSRKTADVSPVTTLTLDNRQAGKVYLFLRDGVVVGACGEDPIRFMGLTEAQARHLALSVGRAG